MLHARAFKVTVVWTLFLLFLGSVVHATESSLACPDWPTCFGTMVPEMTGGVFWEHLHRLVAGGLVLMFALGTWLVRKEAPDQSLMFKACLAGMALLIVQSVFGGITVIYQLPDLVSTTHLALAFLFLVLATVLASATWQLDRQPMHPATARRVHVGAAVAAGLVFVQSVLGGLVRHMDAGVACPDVPLCLGQVVPPLINPAITSHFFHRVLAVVATATVIYLMIWARKAGASERARRWLDFAAMLVVLQFVLGVLSVLTLLDVAPVSLHTLFAASLLAVLAHVSTLARMAPVTEAEPAEAATV